MAAAFSRDLKGTVELRDVRSGKSLKLSFMRLDTHPLTPKRWNDLGSLLRGRDVRSRVVRCMFYAKRQVIVPQDLSLREARKRSLKKLVDRDVVPGLLGYHTWTNRRLGLAGSAR